MKVRYLVLFLGILGGCAGQNPEPQNELPDLTPPEEETPDLARRPDLAKGSSCGDGQCDPSESCSSCAADCGSCPVQKRVFVSSEKYTGDLVGEAGVADPLAAGDKLCTDLATAAGLGGAWEAWLSTTTTNAIKHISGSGPWHDMNGALVFADHASLGTRKDSWYMPQDEYGMVPPEAMTWNMRVWSGTANDGRVYEYQDIDPDTGAFLGDPIPMTCGDWSSTAPVLSGRVGNPAFPGTWTSSGMQSCPGKERLYCFEK